MTYVIFTALIRSHVAGVQQVSSRLQEGRRRHDAVPLAMVSSSTMLTRSLVVCFAFMCARAELMRQARCLQIMTRAGGRWAESPIALRLPHDGVDQLRPRSCSSCSRGRDCRWHLAACWGLYEACMRAHCLLNTRDGARPWESRRIQRIGDRRSC